MSIQISAPFSNPNLPLATPLSQQIKGIAGYLAWFEADAKATIMDGTTPSLITTFKDLAGGATTFSQATSAKKATLASGKFGAYSGAVFDGANDLYAYSAALTLTSAFTWVVIFNPNAVTSYLLSSFTSASQRSLLTFNSGAAMSFNHGAGALSLGIPAAGAPHIAIVSSNTTQLKGMLDGVAATPITTDNNAGTNGLALGSLYPATANGLFSGAVADVMLFSADLLDPSRVADLTKIRQFATNVYGLTA